MDVIVIKIMFRTLNFTIFKFRTIFANLNLTKIKSYGVFRF